MFFSAKVHSLRTGIFKGEPNIGDVRGRRLLFGPVQYTDNVHGDATTAIQPCLRAQQRLLTASAVEYRTIGANAMF